MRDILVMVESASAVGRGIAVGVWRSKRGFGDFRASMVDQLTDERWRRALDAFDGDGVIARVHSPEMAKLLRTKKVPVVDVLGTVPNAGFPIVAADDAAIGREGARHLREVGHTHFGFLQVSDDDDTWAQERRRAFEDAVGRRPVNALEIAWNEISSEKARPKLAKWLEELPKPIGVMACSDRMGMMLVGHCARLGIAVPEAISVVGADDDEVACAMSEVPLSSVKLDHTRIGSEALNLLDRLLRGDSPPRKPILIAPEGVVTRASTDVLAIDDAAVVTALKFIREKAYVEVDLEEVARRSGLSRTRLQRRFREALGRSVHDEVVRVRLERAKHLLSETELAIPVVAERSGVHSQAYLCRLFQQKFGTTPARYRRETRSLRKVQRVSAKV